MISSLLDAARILIVSVTFFLGGRIGFEHGHDPVAQLHFMIPIVVTVAGISGIEGLLDGKRAAAAKGFAFFLAFSGVNHAVDAFRRRNVSWQNVNRPFISLLLIGGMIYPVVLALKGL
jgi:hypothetical protein